MLAFWGLTWWKKSEYPDETIKHMDGRHMPVPGIEQGATVDAREGFVPALSRPLT